MTIRCADHHCDIGLCGCDPDEQYTRVQEALMRQSHPDLREAAEKEAATPTDTGDGPVSILCEAEWQALCEKDDRTSPEEYPEMCLITHNELAMAICEGFLLAKDQDRAALDAGQQMWGMITDLRREEGASITLLCDNPEAFGPANAIEVCGAWTNWQEFRFEGESLTEAVIAAWRAMRAAGGEGPWVR
jgi:hypothetical protein